MFDAGGSFAACAEVAFGSNLMFVVVGFGNAEGADHYAHPASDAFIFIVQYRACNGIAGHCSGHAGADTRSILAMAALKSEGKKPPFFDHNGSTWPHGFIFECLEYFFAFGMLDNAMYFAKPASDTIFFVNPNLFHITMPFLQL